MKSWHISRKNARSLSKRGSAAFSSSGSSGASSTNGLTGSTAGSCSDASAASPNSPSSRDRLFPSKGNASGWSGIILAFDVLFCLNLGWFFRCACHPLVKFLHEKPRIKRLGDVIIHPRFQAAFPVAFERMRRHRNDRDMLAGSSLLADVHGCLQPIHLGHLHIHQDRIVLAFLDLLRQPAGHYRPHPLRNRPFAAIPPPVSG